MTTEPRDSQPDWNQGWQDFVIGLALSFAFIEAINLAILLENRPPGAVATAATALTLVAKILSITLPPVLSYGMYAALAAWTYRAQARMLAEGTTGGLVYGRPVSSPYRLGSVLIFWATILGLFAASLLGNSRNTHTVAVTATILRLSIGIACAWLAVLVRRDIDALMSRHPAEDALMSRHPAEDALMSRHPAEDALMSRHPAEDGTEAADNPEAVGEAAS